MLGNAWELNEFLYINQEKKIKKNDKTDGDEPISNLNLIF